LKAREKSMAKVTLPDGKVLDVETGLTLAQVAEKIGAGLAKAALAAVVNGKTVDLSTPVTEDIKIQIITAKNPGGIEIIRHSCAHVMAEAICSLWPKAQLVYGPTVEDGFYYDIDLDDPIRPEDFEKIEKKMAEIAEKNVPFVRKEISREQAAQHVSGNRYKIDNVNRAQGDMISFYSHGGGFEDLCRGPHVPSTGNIGFFKVMSVAGAYWHGDAKEKMLQRVYGTAWPTKKELDDYLFRLEEAKKRDHRFLGKQLDI